ncbi:uncharacterized protein C6orf106 homolog [Copidosoma floridanum]|uniref:uncharacterized protein C6orf106 homolog n=1 Tax=Copidosoma floridanum TaxID=29053 RepID=UPI0006C95E26|nr:uncharacterized protein C6orf106 homolog [Copidosoma floridanum]
MDADELDQRMMQSFRCLGVADKVDLVKQLKAVAGSHLNDSVALFFLEMNDWNVQAAIGSYFDFEATRKLPCMTLVCDSTIGEGEDVPPLTKFRKTWRIQNSGTEDWPEGVCLTFTNGERMGDCTSVPVPCLPAKDSIEISIDFVSPPSEGLYQSKWRMTTSNGSFFGDVIWVIITVEKGGTLALTQQLHLLSTSQATDEQM